MNKSGIYFIRNILDNKIYVGSAVNFNSRWRRHKNLLRNKLHHCLPLQNAWNLYGELVFAFECVELIDNKNMLLLIEQNYLDKYWDNGTNCYNICKDAMAPMTGRKHTVEARRKMSRPCSEELKEKFSLLYTGKKTSDATKLKMSLAQQGRIVSAETRKKLSLARKRQEDPRKGKRHSEETRRKMSLNMLGKVRGKYKKTKLLPGIEE